MSLQATGKSSLATANGKDDGNVATELYRWLETMRRGGVGVVFGRA
jgi:hypothetical protein